MRVKSRALAYVGLSTLLAAVSAEAFHVLFGNNLHTVIPGRVYRCAQQTGQGLEQLVRAHDIRTVINLRGCAAPFPWYLEECRTTHHLNISQEDINLSAGRFPAMQELRRLVEVLDHTAYPVLIHCRHGADRTGLVSAMVLLLQPGIGLGQARRQLTLRYGHLAVGRPAALDHFLDLYSAWLEQQHAQHSAARFRQWITGDGCPRVYDCVIEPLDFPESVPLGKSVAVHVRAWNVGAVPWRLRPGANAGIHACFTLKDAAENCLAVGKAGLFDAVVPSGSSIDLTLALPEILAPGRYRLMVDMVDEAQCLFFQVGAEPLERVLFVHGSH